MQDASINAVNSSAYGSGGSGGQGSTSVGSTGLYEFVKVVSILGSTVTFSPALTNTYRNAPATTTSGQKTYQVVRVPQYTSASVSGVTAPAWNGATGGVVAIDARDTLTLNGATVENQASRAIFLAGKGFRGAAANSAATLGSRDDWMGTYAAAGGGGGKGEGIAGTPRFMASKGTAYGAKLTNAVLNGGITQIDNVDEGYPGGSRARGAPGNAGGGGADGAPAGINNNNYNAGGGGGGNYAAGGLGGRPWNYPLVDSGGRGGGGYVGTTAFNRIFLGGGGGAGSTNNGTADTAAYSNNGIGCADSDGRCSSGASGGGIVILRAQNVTGTGVIDVRGANGYNVQNDAAGGGGAGGSVVIHTLEGGSAVIDASGGDGGNAWAGSQSSGSAGRHGPGGGGGGGFIAFSPSNMVVTTTINGGTPGYTTNGTSDNYGAFGNQGGIASFQSPNAPGTLPGAACAPDLRLSKSNGATTVDAGGNTTYTLTASNVGASPTTGTITVVDKLPQGFTIPAGGAVLTGANASNWSCSGAALTRVITCTSTTAIAANSSSVFGFNVNVGLLALTGDLATNKAKIGGGGDPLNSAAPSETTVDACTANQSPIGCAIDVDAVNSPLLNLTNSDGADTVLAGGSTTYSLTVANVGNAPTSGAITVVDVLPSGMSYGGATTFTSGGFNCTYTSGTTSFSCVRNTAIAAGASVVITLPVAIAGTAPSALVNLARVGGGSDSSKQSAPTVASTQSCSPAVASDISTGCAADTDAVKRVLLTLTKDDGRFGIYVNGTTTYAFRVSNTGDTASVGTISFRDVLPSPMNWPAALTKTGANAADWTCTRVSGTDVTCTSTIAIAAGGVSQFSLLANAGAMNSGDQYMNKARVGGGGDATLATASPTNAEVGLCTNNSIPGGCAIDLNTAQTPPTLRLTKAHANPQSKAPGDTVAFTLTVTNATGAGEALANTVRVVDVFPAGLGNFTVTATQGVFSCAMGSGADSNVLTCNNTGGVLAAASSTTIAVNATVTATTSTTLLNKAQVGTDNTDPTTSSYPTSTTVAACTAVNTPTAGCATDSIPVVPSATLTVVSSVSSRIINTDQFTVAISNGPSATTSGTATSASTAAFAATPGTSYTLSETASGTTELARYTTTYACTNPTAGGTTVTPGTGTTLNVTPKAGDAITCTFTNTPIAPRLTLAKTIVSRASVSDQFSVAIGNGGPTAFTTGTGTTATTTVFTATAGTSYTLSESALASANLARYTSSYSCTNAGVAGTAMPSGTGTSFTLTPQAGDNISCTFSNSAIAPKLTVNTVVSGRILSTDQFTVGINNGGPSASTSGTQTTASAGPTTATAGTSYLLTETAAGTPATNLARYTTTYACTNATAGGTSVGSGTGTSISVTPQAGDDISCTFTNTPNYPKLTVTKAASPSSFIVGASGQSYRITIGVANGPTTAAISIADSLPTGVTLSGAPTVSGAATLSGCSTSGSSIGACQLASGLADGSYVVTIPVSIASSATSTGAANTANLGGGGDPTCTAAATTEACDPTTGAVAVKTPANVSLVKSGAATAVAGNSYVYTLALTNSGQTATAANVVVRDQLATGMVATAVTGANCGTLPSAAGALLTCTVADPIAADGGSANIQLTVTMPSGGGNVVNYAATHPSGSGNPGVNPGAACTNGTTVVCASSTTASSTPANISLSKTGAATALTGSSYAYTLTLSNSGQLATGSNLIIKDKLPAGVIATAVSGATCGTLPSSAAALLTCTVAGPVAAGGSASVQLTVTLPGTGGTLVNNAATNPTGSGAPGVDPSATCVNSATTSCASHSLSVNTPANLATTNVLTAVNGAAVPVGYLAKPGDVLTYTVTVINSGGTAGSTDVGQTVPAGTTYTGSGQGWGAGCTTAGTQCSQTLPVGANQSSTLTYTVTVASPGSTATIVDTATSSVGTCTTCQVTTGTQQADMDACISVSPGTTSATGVELIYTSICKNNGPQTALNAACTVTPPASAGAVTTCTPTSPAATLASGSSITCITKLTPSVVGDYAVSVATSNTLYDPATGNNSATTTVKVNTPAALRIVKSLAQVNGAAVPNNYAAKIGDTLTYAMLVTNTGGTAGTTVLTETVPEGTKFVGVSSNPSQGWSQAPQACAAAASTCTQSVSVPAQNAQGAAGQQTVQFTVEVLAPATSNGKITNTVSSDMAAACTSGTCVVETANAVADMQAQISAIPATAVVVGQSVTITGTCTNNGPANAVNASCAMTVNNAGTSIAGTCSANTNLAMGSSLSCTATFNAGQGAISATVNTSTQSYESNTANNTDTKSTVGNTPASLATTNVLTAVNGAAVPADYLAKPGDVLTYTVSVTNSGGTAGSTEVGQTVPAGTTYTGTGQGWGAGCAAAGTQCAQTVPVGANQTSTVSYTVTVASPGSTPTIVDTATSSVGTCTTCVVTTNTQQADMQASVTVTPGTTSTTGVELIYTAVCKNNGPQAALNASCVVSAPAGASAAICTPTSPAATLASGDSITCVTKLTPSTAGDYAVSVATSNNLYDAAPGNNSASTTVKVNTPAALNIVKSLVQVNGAALPASYAAKIGDKLTYAMLVTNTGGTAGTTVLTETVPEGTQFVGTAADPSQGWSQTPTCGAAGSTCEQSVNVPAQTAQGPGEKIVEFTVEVIAPATTNGKITNTVLSDVATACVGTNCSVETSNAVADMQAQITSIPAGALVVGDSVTITGVCTNNGPVSAANASCAMVVSNGGASITATCDAAKTLAVNETLGCSATFVAAQGDISASVSAATQSYESDKTNNTDSKSTVGNTPASLATTNVLTAVNGSPVPAGYLAKPGDVLTYTVSVVNSGGTAGSTEVGQTVPAGTTYTGTGQGWGAGCAAAGTQCAQTVPVGANQTSTVSYTVTVASPGSTPTIVDTATSSVGTCTTCVVTTNTQQADIQASVTVTPGATSTTGVELIYTSVCKNNGPQSALNAACVVTAPANAVTACAPTTPAATLALGDSITCTTKLTPSTAGDYAVSVVTSNDLYDKAPANNTANTSVKVNTPAALNIVKSLVQVNGVDATAGYATKIGDKLTYAMVVTNTGGTAGTTVLTETVPEGTKFVGVSTDPTQGWSEVPQKCDAAGTSCEQGVNVPAQTAEGPGEKTVEFTVEVTAPATSNGKITNTVLSDVATACAGANCNVETNNAVADMQAQITDIPASAVVVGQSVTITGVCTNNGPAIAASASCAMVVSNGGASITATCDAAKTLAVGEALSCSATFVAAQGDISASVSAATQSYESDKTNNTDSKSTVGNTPASLATTNVLTLVNGSPKPADYLAKPGDVLTYTVTVVNSGGTAGSTNVGQTVPAGTTYTGSGQGWSAGCAAAGTQCAQPVSVGAGQTSTVSYTVTVTSPGSTSTIVNTATSTVGTCTTCVVTTNTQQADMQATVTVTPGATSTTGVELIYTAVCKNNGPQAALNASCVVTAPAGASAVVCTPTSPAATLASGDSITCVTKLTPSTAGDYAVSVATSNNLYDAASGNNSATTTVKVNTPAALNIVKSLALVNDAAVPANYAAKIGDKLTYAMVVTNTGGTAGTTVLTETVPEGTQFVGGIAPNESQGWGQVTQVCDAAGSTCTQSVTVPAQGADGVAGAQTVQFTVEVIAPATSNGKITNTVESSAGEACTSGACSVETANAVADMQAQITSIPASAVVVGQSVTITGVCTNNGPASAVNASCAMAVINGGTSIAGICGANASLLMGESISCSATFTAAEGTISATINTTTQSYESDITNNTDSKSTVGNTPASLATTNVLTAVNGAAVPANYLAKPGDALTYTVSVTNSGGTAGSTEVGQTVPAGTTYTGTGQGWGAGCAAAGTQCAQTVPVGAGETKTVQYTVTVANPGSTATIVDTATSSVGTCTTCQVTTDTQRADMAATVTVTPGATSTTGVELIYTAVCKNNGPQAALNASCVVTAPAGASAAICTPTSPAATLASGDSITCVTKLTPSTAGDYALSVATSNDLYDATPANNTANISVKVNTPAALNIVKSLAQVNGADVPASYAAKIGDKLTYAMVVTNTGGTAGTTVLTETVPEGTQFVGGGSSDPTQGWSEVPQKCDAAGTNCEQSVNVTAQTAEGPGEKAVEFTVEVIAPATSNGKITNTVASDIAAACAGNACSVETDNAVADMQAQITSIPAGALVVGDSVTITGLCTNNGPASAASASCAMVVSNGGASITATCDAAKTLAVNETLGCSATFVAAQGDISASVSAATQSYESDKTNNTDSKSTVGNTPASLVTTNVLTAVNGSPVPAGYLAKPGDALTYTVSVTNSGGTAGSTEVGQTVPAGTTYTGTGQGWGAGCAAAGTQCAQTVPVGAGETKTVQYTVTVANPGSTATIVDTATSSVGTCTTCQVTTDTQRADMAATVTVTPGAISTTGVELIYTSVCKNNGPQSALNAACVVTAPAGASAVVCTPTSPAATLASGDSITCVTKLTPSTAGDYALSVATSNDLYDATPANNTANTSVKVNTPAALNIVKSLALVNDAAVPANYAAKIGDKLTYAMVVTNAGGTAGTTVLTETVPEGTQFVGTAADPSQGWSQAPVCEAAGTSCEQSVNVPAQTAEGPGEKIVEFTVEVIAPATSNGKIANTVLSDVATACVGANCSVETSNAVADMQAQITNIPASAVVVGQSVTITGVCTNKGPADAVNASCEMTVNNGGTSIAATCGANVNLAVNDSISCTASFTAVEGAISASINAATQSYESNTANNTDTKSTVGNTAASLVTTNVLTAVNGNPVPADYLAKPGDVLTYTVTVVNNGGTAGSTDVGQTVPAGTTYSGTGEGWGAGCAAAASTCNQMVAVGAGQTSTASYTVTVAGPGSAATIVNTATSSVGTCSACQVTTGTQHADMQATVTVTPGSTSTTGVELIYTSVCKNNGPQSAINASCVVTAPANAQTNCSAVSPVASLSSGESITCTTKLTPSDAGDYAVSVATSNDLYDPAPGNNTATKTVKVNTPAELNITKTLAQVNGAAVPDNYAAKIGDTLTYNLRVTNAGGTASTMELTETVPEGTKFVGGGASNPDQGWSLAPNVCDAAASTCTQSVTVPAQNAGAPGDQSVQFTVEVLAPATSSGKIINTVISDVPAACAAGGCTAETVNAVADMQAQITTIPSRAVVVGQSVTISGQCVNNGPVDAINASCVMTVNNGGESIAATCGANTNLAVGESISCTVTFAAAEGAINASITAATESYDSDIANNSDTKAVNGNTPSAVTVTNVLVKVNDAPVPAGYVIRPGDKLTYQVQVRNTGGTPGATTLTETVPAGTRYVGTDEGWTASCVAAGSTCSQPATVPGGSPQAPGTVAFEYTVRVDDTVTSPNVVNVVGSSAPGSCSAACSVSTPTQAADMQVSMPATIDAKVGVEFTLTSICRNAGPATATNARCDVSGAPAGAVTVCTPTQPVAALAVGEAITCTTKFTPTSTAALTITTRASSGVYDPVAANSEASASAVYPNTPPTDVKRVPVNAAWAMALMALLLMLLAGKAMPQRQVRRRQD